MRTTGRSLSGAILILIARASLFGDFPGNPAGPAAPQTAPGADLAAWGSDTPAPSRVAREVFWLETRLPLAGSAPEHGKPAAKAMVESRRLPARIARAPGKADSEAMRVYAAAELQTEQFYIAAGRRYLPGPRTSFLAHPGLTGGLSGMTPARGIGSVFANLPGLYFLAGLFALEDTRRPGFFWADPGRAWFFAYHPETRQGALAANSAMESTVAHLSWVVDMTANARTIEGYARLHLSAPENPESEKTTTWRTQTAPDWQFLIEGERRESWDYRDFAGGAIFEERAGNSGLAFIRGDFWNSLSIMAGGQDIGADGMRIARIGARLNRPGPAPRFAVDGGMYRRRTYDSEGGEYLDPAVGGELSASRRNFFFSARVEQRRSSFTAGEIAGGLRAGPYRFEIAGIAREPLASPTGPRRATESIRNEWTERHRFFPGGISRQTPAPFLYLYTDAEAETGARFLREESGALRVRLSGPNLYFLVSAAVVAGRPRAFSLIQFQMPLESD